MKEEIKEQIAVSSFWNFLMVLCARVGGLIFTILVARFLLPENFGIYNLAMAIALLLLVSIDTGINQSILKYISEAIGKNNKKLAAADARYLFRLKLGITLLLAFLLLILAYPISYYFFGKPALFFPLLMTSLYVISYSVGSFYEYLFYVIEKVKYITVKQLIFETTRIFLVLGVILFIGTQYYVLGTIGVLAFSMFIAGSFLFFNVRRLIPFLFEKTEEKVDRKRIFTFFLYLSTIGSFLVLFGYIDTIILGIFLDSSYVGYYNAALALTSGLWSILNISNIMLPIFTRMNNHDLHTAANKVFRYLSLFAIPAIFGIFALGKYGIRFVYGYEYLPAVLPFYILSLLVFEVPFISILTSLFSAKEEPKYVVRIVLWTTILNIVLNYIFVSYLLRFSPNHAVAGAATATVISQTTYLLGLLFYANRTLQLRFHVRFLVKPTIASFCMFGILYGIGRYFSEINIFIGLGEIILGIVIYFFVMLLIGGITKEDFFLFNELIRRSK